MRTDAACEPLWPEGLSSPSDFIDTVLTEGARYRRDLPWRYLDDAYQVLVSEVMLQQTQVKRVLRFWPRFMDLFPTLDALAAADSADVLEEWQGLGYNRRALALHRCAVHCSRHNGGRLPCSIEELCALPGIGPATAAGVMAFAYNEPCVYLETNVRSVFIHELFPDEEAVTDKRLIPLIRAVCPEHPRDWYYALLDYGAHLKASGVNPSRRSAHYTRQSAFEGSRRQKRSEILRVVLDNPGSRQEDIFDLVEAQEREAGRGSLDEGEFASIMRALLDEGFFRCDEGRYFV